MAFGAAALLGWATGRRFLAAFDDASIPMAPSTALLFVVLGAVAGVAARPGRGSGARIGASLIAGLAALATLLLLLASVRGTYWGVEHLGLRIDGRVAGWPLGHISPVAAAAFLLVSLALLALQLPPGRGRKRAWFAAAAGLVVLAGGGVFFLAYVVGEPLLYRGSVLPPSAPTSTALVTLGLAVVLAARAREPRRDDEVRLPRSAEAMLAALYFLLAGGIVLWGTSWFGEQERRLKERVDLQISTIAKLKATDLARWRTERLGNGRVLQESRAVRRLVDDFLARTISPDDEAILGQSLGSIRESYGYVSVEVLDADGVRRLAIPSDAAPVEGDGGRHFSELLRSGEARLVDLHVHETGGPLRMAVVIPVVVEGRPRGAVLLGIDVPAYLETFLSDWPVPSQTAATFLVRKEGDTVLVARAADAAGTQAEIEQAPIAQVEPVFVRAALGEETVGYFPRADGRQVVAAARRVAGSPWNLVAHVDAEEAYGPLRERLWLTVLAMAGLLAAVAAGVWAVWRRQLARVERGRRLAEREGASLREVIERSLNEIFIFDPVTFRFLFANRGAARNLGYSEEELRGMTPINLVPGMTPDDLGAMLRAADARPGEVHRFETTHRRKDGSLYPIEVNLQRVSASAGDVYLAVIIDVTERQAAERRIRHLNRVYAVLSEVNQAIVRERDVPSLAAEACRIAVEVGGFREARLLLAEGDGIRCAGRTPAADAEETASAAAWAEALALESIRSGCSVTAPARHERVAAIALPLVVEGRAIGAFVLAASLGESLDAEEKRLLEEMAFDVSFALETIRGEAARREAEAEVRRLNADLERRVEERTAELASAVRELETFAYSVSHDLKAPLRAIDGYSHLLVEEHGRSLDAKARDYLDRVRAGARRMGELIDALLAYSRVERKALQPETISLAESVRLALAHVQEEIASTGASVKVAVDGLVVRADREGLAIVFRNLLGNALKFRRGAEAPAIEIGGEAAEGVCRFWVRDHGVGFDSAYSEKMFDIFQRLHRQEEFPGTGIGLALVRKAVERMGGSIRAEGTPDRGATFFVELPGGADAGTIGTEA
ncbi:MAG: ATP-binding protein [Thermoanaerobaculia bacterium]